MQSNNMLPIITMDSIRVPFYNELCMISPIILHLKIICAQLSTSTSPACVLPVRVEALPPSWAAVLVLVVVVVWRLHFSVHGSQFVRSIQDGLL